MAAPVLLGLLDEEVGTYGTSAYTSKIGGTPDWLVNAKAVARCGLCGRVSALVGQIYCPLTDSQYHRTLYIFACVSSNCWNQSQSWTIIRCQKLADDAAKKKDVCAAASPRLEMDWGGGLGAGDWGEADSQDWGDKVDDKWGNTDAGEWGNQRGALTEAAVSSTVTVNTAIAEPEVNKLNVGDAHEFSLTSSGKHTESNTASTSDIGTENTHATGYDDTQSLTTRNNTQTKSFADIVKHSTDDVCEDAIQQLEHMDINEGVIDSNISVDVPSLENAQYMCELLKTQTPSETQSVSTCEEELVKVYTQEAVDFVSYFVSVVEEPSGDDEKLQHERRLLADYCSREGVRLDVLSEEAYSKVSKRGGGEKYEMSSVAHGDQVFHRFTKRVSHCPQQVLRYQWAGEPLHMRREAALKVPVCQNCGCHRVFELQLMPALVSMLTHKGGACVEFGSVHVYSCSGSCWHEGATHRLESCHLQPDPDTHLFQK